MPSIEIKKKSIPSRPGLMALYTRLNGVERREFSPLDPQPMTSALNRTYAFLRGWQKDVCAEAEVCRLYRDLLVLVRRLMFEDEETMSLEAWDVVERYREKGIANGN